MALHGDIRVNGQLIVSWSARRLTDLDPSVDEYAYECEVVWANPTQDRATFTVTHPYDAGATALAATVLGAAVLSAPQQGLRTA